MKERRKNGGKGKGRVSERRAAQGYLSGNLGGAELGKEGRGGGTVRDKLHKNPFNDAGVAA